VIFLEKSFIIYHKAKEIDIFIDFLRFSQTISIQRITDEFLEIKNNSIEDEIDLAHLREMSLQEILHDFTGFELPRIEYFDREILYQVMPKLGYGTFDVCSLIHSLSKRSMEEREWFKQIFVTHFGWETVDTVLGFIENDMNASKASKKLYMHRNTINYRLDHFIEKSEINVRTFLGAFAFYSLFN